VVIVSDRVLHAFQTKTTFFNATEQLITSMLHEPVSFHPPAKAEHLLKKHFIFSQTVTSFTAIFLI